MRLHIIALTILSIYLFSMCTRKVVVHDSKYDYSFHYKSQIDTSTQPSLNIVINKLNKNKIIIKSVIDSTTELKIVRTESNLLNPFSPFWHVDFQILKNGHLTINFHYMKGQFISELFHGFIKTGIYEIGLSENNIISGIYIFEFIFNNHVIRRKIPIIK